MFPSPDAKFLVDSGLCFLAARESSRAEFYVGRSQPPSDDRSPLLRLAEEIVAVGGRETAEIAQRLAAEFAYLGL